MRAVRNDHSQRFRFNCSEVKHGSERCERNQNYYFNSSVVKKA